MKLLIVGDLHFGANEQYPQFLKYQLNTYLNALNYCRSMKVNNVILLGDVVDNRKALSVTTLKTIQRHLFPEDFNFIILAGNHDVFFKNTNELCSIELLIESYDLERRDIFVIKNPREITLDGKLCLFVPWINEENYDETLEYLENSTAKYCFGHIPIHGELMTKGFICKDKKAFSPKLFKKFKTFAAHFHLKSNFYLGSLSQLDWNDYNDQKHFAIIDFKKDETDYVDSYGDPIFKTIIINEKFKFEDIGRFENKFLRIYINRKLKPKEEKILIDIIENSIKYEVIDNTILLLDDQEINIDELDDDFNEVLKSFTSMEENQPDEVKQGAYDLIMKTYYEVQKGNV